MRRWSLMVAGIAAGMALGACSGFKMELPSKKVDYKSAGKVKVESLEVPPDLTRPTGDGRFDMPKGVASAVDFEKGRGARPETAGQATVLPNIDNARVERAGSQRWLVVNGDPDKLWPVVKDFWQELGFIVDVEMPEAGVMETDWAENRARISDGVLRNMFTKFLDSISSTSERDKFRTRFERGRESGTTEIYISHRGMEEVYTSMAQEQTKWQPRPSDPELEAAMLGRLMVRLGAQEERARAQVAAPAKGPGAIIQKTAGTQALTLNEPFDRAWRRVGLALDRVGFTVEDRDRSKGVYFVRYIDPGIDVRTGAPEGRGWFGRFFSSKPDPKKAEQYRVVVKDLGERAEVNVLNKEGAPDQTRTGTNILTLLHEQLR